jgi:diaminohydroxyphosphoribosylaminopyrimidine deaminase / 5-amino-6-(5-phosphoribosylamino)uracil reductase
MIGFYEKYMHRCLQLAALGAGYVAPNPLVGSVLVYNDCIIGESWHKQYGDPHAEINCIASVKPQDRHLIPDSTLFVSLEPCAHFGKTPPCAHRIVQEGIKNVVIGAVDTYKEVAGKGVALLRAAGVNVVIGILEQECRWQNRRFFTYHEKQRPYIHLKWATTADGFMSGYGRERLMITNEITNKLVHKWRNEEAAILVGTETAMLDNPSLNNRFWWGRNPVRIISDRNLRIPASHNIFSGGGTTWILNIVKQEVSGKFQWIKLKESDCFHPENILQILYEQGIQSVLIEGGKQVLSSFLESDFWDEIHLLENTEMNIGSGLKAPYLNKGLKKEIFLIGDDRVSRIINN